MSKSVETGLGGERQYDGLDVHVHPYLAYGKEEILNELRRSKSRCKAVFTRHRHQLLVLSNEVDMPSRTQIRVSNCIGSIEGLQRPNASM